MEGADALGLIAEVGIAIAGFAGVVAALRAPGGRMSTYAAMRIGILFVFSASTVLLALLGKGLIRVIPILAGAAVGYLAALVLGLFQGTSLSKLRGPFLSPSKSCERRPSYAVSHSL